MSILSDPLTSLCILAISFLLLPPIRMLVYSKTNKELPLKIRSLAICILLLFFGLFAGQEQDRKNAVRQAQEQAEKLEKQKSDIAYFHVNSAEIINNIRVFIEQKDYQKALSLASRYLVTGNAELLALNTKAKHGLNETQRIERVKSILSSVKNTPNSDSEKLLSFYRQLAVLSPSDKEYQLNVKFYTKKVAEVKEQERLLAIKKEYQKMIMEQKAEQAAIAQAQAEAEMQTRADVMKKLPRCDSEFAKEMAIQAVEESPIRRDHGLSIIKIKHIELIQEGEGVRDCKGVASMNVGEHNISYRFYLDDEGDLMLQFLNIEGVTN